MSRLAGENARQLHLHVCVCDTPAFLVSITLSVRCAVHLGEPPCVYGARCSLWQRGSHWKGAELADRYSFDVGAGVGHWLAAYACGFFSRTHRVTFSFHFVLVRGRSSSGCWIWARRLEHGGCLVHCDSSRHAGAHEVIPQRGQLSYLLWPLRLVDRRATVDP